MQDGQTTVDASILFQIIGEQVVERRLMGQEMNRMQGIIEENEKATAAAKEAKKNEKQA